MKPISSDHLAPIVATMNRAPDGIAGMSSEERREYNRIAKNRSRERQREAMQDGKPMVTTDTVRDLLADIAIAMLAVDADGAKTVMSALEKFFVDRPGYPGQIKARIKSGKLKTKLLAG